MSKRIHATDVGSIACTDLSDLGAGKEAWLVNDPNLLCALDTHSIAIANRYLVFIINWADPDDAALRAKIRPELSPIEAEYITALEWLVFEDIRVVAVATSRGYLFVYDLKGDLVHRQLIHPGRILKLRVRGTKRDLTQETSSEEVCVVMPGVIARFDGSDIQRMLHQRFYESSSQFWDQKPKRRDIGDLGNSYERLPYQLWNVSKYGPCADAAITGIMPPPLMEVQSSQRYYCAVTIGEDAVISAFRLSEDRSRSFVGALLSKVVPATFSTIASFSKMIWRSEQPQPKPEPKPQPFARASALTCLKDHPRKGERLTLSPSGTLAAITDSLGRILLLDTQALVVVRLWKIWQMRTGPRLSTIQCAKGSKMLQPTYRFGSSMSSSPYVPLEVFLLNGDSGQLSVLNRSLN
ncbi:hypothetical protein JRO89_XS15G0085800 [Xanthoceras sorbifolium]|uniref:Rab3-GAP regulatory subunit N-terminal domain-containing protein n=1 Tax=Xanthoceras sorbifolium TaxID=99658 RepID=A0ABQ8H1D0_9ROSI|nr:hypothetical protein JRO89_XS15G0085800 [Xanthoceras sorbifolium]